MRCIRRGQGLRFAVTLSAVLGRGIIGERVVADGSTSISVPLTGLS